MNKTEKKIRDFLQNRIRDDQSIDLMHELQELLHVVGLDIHSAGGSVSFQGKDPIIKSPLPLASMASVGLMAKAIAATDLWMFRGGKGQDLSIHLGQVLHRLCPFYDKKWELLNDYPPALPSDPTNPFNPIYMYQTRDGRFMHMLNVYPRTKTSALDFLGCQDTPQAIAEIVRRWDGITLEDEMNKRGLQATMIRSIEEFMETEQYHYIKDLPLIEIEKIGDSAPVPLPANPKTPLDGVRILGMGHVIAGAGLGRALSYHGADVLNIWCPIDFELDMIYYSSNVGMRSSTLELASPKGMAKFMDLLKDADVFFSNRRPGYINKYGLTTQDLAQIHPGIIGVEMSLFGHVGPWANRIGFDQNAGGATGVFTLEGSQDSPKLTDIFVVNDYIMSWLGAIGIMTALKRRAIEGGSYRIRLSLTRLSLWLLQMGIFDKGYAYATAGIAPDHEDLDPEIFTADTPCGVYQGVTDQIQMAETPGFYKFPLVPRGSSTPRWLPREQPSRLFALVARPPSIVSMNSDGTDIQTIVADCGGTPDGIAVDAENKHIYWTNMGENFSANDGFIERVDFDGSNRKIIIPKGSTFTPKQLQFDKTTHRLYWCDREGMRIMRAHADGSCLETLVETGSTEEERADATHHCVGIALDVKHGYLYWTQKGPEKGGKGRIFRAKIDIPPGSTPQNRQDIEVLFEGLPEPIDLEIDHANSLLYWTDRGAPPKGNTLNRAKITPQGCDNHEILCGDLEEGIGLALDLAAKRAFISDLGGRILVYSLDQGGSPQVIFKSGPLTGIAWD